jgi:hypothetical protein
MEVTDTDEGHKYWSKSLQEGMKRPEIENFFRKIALEKNQEGNKVEFSTLLDKDDEGRRVLFVMPESIGDVFLSTSLFGSIKRLYPDYNLYIATNPDNFQILDGNPHVHKCIPYMPQMDNQVWLEGAGPHKGFFNIAFLPHVNTQRMLTYLHNAEDKLDIEVKE